MVSLPALFVLSTFVLAYLAFARGYSVAAWVLGGGFIGVAVISFLPDVSPVMGKEREGSRQQRKAGNIVGIALSGLTVILISLFLWGVWEVSNGEYQNPK